MKKLIVIFILIFSISALANEQSIKCTYDEFDFKKKYKKNITGLNKKLVNYFLPFNLELELLHKNKRNWTIVKKESSEIQRIINKIILVSIKNPDEYSEDDHKSVTTLTEIAEMTKSEYIEDQKFLLDVYGKDELKKMMSEKMEEVKNNFYNSIGNIPDDVLPWKEIDEDPNKTPLDNLTGKKLGNHVILTWTLDSGVMIRNKLQYPDILEKNKTKAFIQIINTDGDIIGDVPGNCYNSKISTKNQTSSNDEEDNDITKKLKKLKLLFLDELITQEEYDAKRKEILDEM